MNGKVGVAISTTGDEHRLEFLETCVHRWKRILFEDEPLIVTVDGDDEAVLRVVKRVVKHTDLIYQVGVGREDRQGHQGVAVNKNTGLELLIDSKAHHLFLCDDDTWPLRRESINRHIDAPLVHSIVGWGKSRFKAVNQYFAEWNWPRGVVNYVRREVVEQIGGMIEDFGPGGHEHVEWSRRIHQAHLTPVLFPSPPEYAQDNSMGARRYWHAEDMPRPGEPLGTLRLRKRKNTSVRRRESDWVGINQIFEARDGDTTFVPFRSYQNSRGSATLWSQLIRAEEPETP